MKAAEAFPPRPTPKFLCIRKEDTIQRARRRLHPSRLAPTGSISFGSGRLFPQAEGKDWLRINQPVGGGGAALFTSLTYSHPKLNCIRFRI